MICMRDGRYPVAETEMNFFNVFVIVWGSSSCSVEYTGDRLTSDVALPLNLFAPYIVVSGRSLASYNIVWPRQRPER
jgi:hypothetical protein